MAVEFEGPVTGGNGVNLMSMSSRRELSANGFVEEEWFVDGSARSFRAVSDLGFDGRWEVEALDTAAFRTRIVVRRPTEATAFNGTLLMEWHNVSAGGDAAPDWTYLAPEILRGGFAWVGVSAQQIGVSGGASLVGFPDSGGLVGTDPERYGSLVHPGDEYSYDLFTQVARGLCSAGSSSAASSPALGGLLPDRIIAVGESQSAFRLSTYANAMQVREGLFDGFLVHSRGDVVADLGADSRVTGHGLPRARFRDDLGVPVLVIETETDLVSVFEYYNARQPDGEHLRVWEVAGSAHADSQQIGGDPDAFGCTHLVNDGLQHVVLRAGIRHLDRWIRTGTPPPIASRLTVRPGPVVVRDGRGNALGGIRTPVVDVPAATMSGEPADCGSKLCFLFGQTVRFEPDLLVELYGDADGYRAAFAQATDDVIAAGFVLEDDRPELDAVAEANAARFP